MNRRKLISITTVAGLSLAYAAGGVAATASAPVSVNILPSIDITTLSGMAFGDISSSSVAGTIVISTNGDRTVTGGVSVNSAIPGSPAAFDVSGEVGAAFAISLPPSVLLNSGASNMLVDQFLSSPANGALDEAGQQEIFIGGRLNVNSNQPIGSYADVLAVTVEYN